MIHRTTPEACRLFIEGQLMLAECEAVGVRVDKARLESTIKSVEQDIANSVVELHKDKVARYWKKVYGDSMNFGSRDQLADILFNPKHLGLEIGGITRKGRAGTGKEILEKIDIPFVKKYLKIEPMKKSLSTNLIGIRRLMVERDGMWFVHPNFNLNLAQTLRSSSDGPNWQNFPKRNPEIAALVRPNFIPRPGNHFCEPDFGQIEVRVPAALTGDAELNRYIHEKNSDMHRDQACEVWKLKPKQVSKPIRQSTKGDFVFATFYGSPYYNTAKRLWDDIDRFGLKLVDGTPLKKHLRRNGIVELGECDPEIEPRDGTFVKHMKACERKLWRRFNRYKEWKEEQVEKYRREGGLTMVTGFAVTGIHSRTEIANYGIQGPAFHCLLWAMIRLVKRLRKYKMKSLVLGEIHDSIQLDIRHRELQDVLDMVHSIMVKELPKAWTWLTVPLSIEIDVSPKNGSWYACKEWTRDESGLWSLKA